MKKLSLLKIKAKILAFILIFLSFGCQKSSDGFTIFITKTGSDSNTGNQDSPFLTFERVTEEINHILSTQDSASINIRIGDGEYQLSKTILLSSENFKSNQYSIHFNAMENTQPVITSGKEIKGWEKIDDSLNIWKAALRSDIAPRELFVNGELATLARGKEIFAKAWDKTDDPQIEKANLIGNFTTYQGELPVYEGYTLTGEYRNMMNWKYPSDIEAVYLQGWAYVVCPVKGIMRKESDIYMEMEMPAFKDAQIKGGVHVGDPSYFQNAIELLDEPGEWYFDRMQSEVFYIPKNGESVQDSEIIVPTLEKLVELEGNIEKTINNITFEGIAFNYTTYLKPGIEGYAEVQATLTKDPNEDYNMHGYYQKMDAAISLDYSKDITFTNCLFSKFGGTGINVNEGCSNVTIESSHLFDIGGNAIQIGGFNLTDAHPDDERKVVTNTSVTNNLIHDIGVVYKGSIGVLAGYTKKTEITHNELFDIAYSGISVGWGWGFWDKGGKVPENPNAHPKGYPLFDKPTVSANHLIGWNHVYNVMNRLSDGAGIYTISMMGNSKIIGNHVHDNPEDLNYQQSEFLVAKYTQGWPGGIYLDEGSGGIEVTNNIVYNVIQPYFYNNLEYDGYPWYEREETNNVHDNFFAEMPYNSDELRYLGKQNTLGIDLESLPGEAQEIINKAGRTKN